MFDGNSLCRISCHGSTCGRRGLRADAVTVASTEQRRGKGPQLTPLQPPLSILIRWLWTRQSPSGKKGET